MKFEKFYLIEQKSNNKVNIKFFHIQNMKEIKCSFFNTLKILQNAEIQVKTQFVTEDFIQKYASLSTKNLKNISLGSSINIYYIPVIFDSKLQKYIPQFNEN